MIPRRTPLPEDARTSRPPPSGWQGLSCLAGLTELRRRFRPAGHGDSITGFAVRWRPPVFPRSPDPLRLLTRREPGHPPRDSSSVLLRATSELLWGQSRVGGWRGRGVARGPWPSFPSDCRLLLLLLFTVGCCLKTSPACHHENPLSRSRGRERKRVRGALLSLGLR